MIAFSKEENKLKIDFIFPANKKVVDKYRKKQIILYTETYEIYLNKTKRYIESIDPKHTKWIENAIYDNTEKILFFIPNEFIILKDYNTVDNKNILNCLGFPYEKIKCLRDLDGNHIKLLEKFYYQGVKKLFFNF